MSAVRSTDTKPEVLLRKALHRNGLRFRLHADSLRGRPDIVLPKYRAIIFVNGCFWHVHECAKFRWPKTRAEFWRSKLLANRARDMTNVVELTESGWRVAVVWECALAPVSRADETAMIITRWVRFGVGNIDIASPEE